MIQKTTNVVPGPSKSFLPNPGNACRKLGYLSSCIDRLHKVIWVFLCHWFRFICCFHGRICVNGSWYSPIQCIIISDADHWWCYWVVDCVFLLMIPWMHITLPINHWLFIQCEICHMGISVYAIRSNEELVTALYLLMCLDMSMEKL